MNNPSSAIWYKCIVRETHEVKKEKKVRQTQINTAREGERKENEREREKRERAREREDSRLRFFRAGKKVTNPHSTLRLFVASTSV